MMSVYSWSQVSSIHGTYATRVLISPWPDQEGNKLQRPNSKFASHLKKKSEICPSKQVSASAMTSSSDEKWRPVSFFFSRVGLRTYQHSCILPSVTVRLFSIFPRYHVNGTIFRGENIIENKMGSNFLYKFV